MISNHKRLQELRQQAKELEEKIEQLQDQLNNAEPTTGLLGQWATNRHGKRVLITTDRPVDGWIETTFVSPDGTTSEKAEQFDSLTFPDQTTRPEDVPVGEAWLVDACDDVYDTRRESNIVALKVEEDTWTTTSIDRDCGLEWHNHEITLITPLIPARPHDTPETVTTEEEYEALPEGSVIVSRGGSPWTRGVYGWTSGGSSSTTAELAGTTRRVLRRGWWGE